MPTKLGEAAGCSITRPCECGLGLRPSDCSGSLWNRWTGRLAFPGPLTLGGCGLQSTDRFADCFVAGNDKIQGGLTAELFVSLLGKMMRHRTKPVHLVVDGLPAHRTKLVKDFVQSTRGRLTLHILPGYAPELNPDEAVWSHMKRTGVARTPLREGERLRDKIDAQLASIKAAPKLVRSFFQAPSVAYIADW